MVSVTDFTLEPLPAPDEQTRLFHRGQAVTDLDGRTLAAQFRCGSDYLLLLTEDNPFEETLHIYLLGSNLMMQDRLDLDNPYTPGLLTDVQVVGQRQLDFSFFGDDRWRLTVLDAPRFRWPLRLFSTVKRPVGQLFSRVRLSLLRLRQSE